MLCALYMRSDTSQWLLNKPGEESEKLRDACKEPGPWSAWEMIPAPKGHFPPGETVILGVVSSLFGTKAAFPLPAHARRLTVSHQANAGPLLSAALWEVYHIRACSPQPVWLSG